MRDLTPLVNRAVAWGYVAGTLRGRSLLEAVAQGQERGEDSGGHGERDGSPPPSQWSTRPALTRASVPAPNRQRALPRAGRARAAEPVDRLRTAERAVLGKAMDPSKLPAAGRALPFGHSVDWASSGEAAMNRC